MKHEVWDIYSYMVYVDFPSGSRKIKIDDEIKVYERKTQFSVKFKVYDLPN